MNLNKVLLAGNMTQDVDLRHLPSGQSVARISLATNRFYTDKTGKKQQQAEFHNIVAWGKLADFCAQFLKKGRLILVEGRLQTRSWKDQNGQTRTRTEIIAERINPGPRPQGKTETTPATEPIEEINLDDLDKDKDIDLSEIPY